MPASLSHQYFELVERFFIPLAVVFGILLLGVLASILKFRLFRTILLLIPLTVVTVALGPYVITKYLPDHGFSDRFVTAPDPAGGNYEIPGIWKYESEDGRAMVFLELLEDGNFKQTVRLQTGADKTQSGVWRVSQGQLEFNHLLLRDINRWKSDPVMFKITGQPKKKGFAIVGGLEPEKTTWRPLVRVPSIP